MEQTLGKRIAEHRKRLKLTQEQLAEQLGITAQAISKWENDQSCPDITVLPRLAKIFGITTDRLLGAKPESQEPPAFEAEVVGAPEDHNFEFKIGDHEGKADWTFNWDSGKRSAMTFAIFVLFVGFVTLLSRLYQWDVSFWSILWPSAGLIFGLSGVLRRFSIFGLGLSIFCGYSLVANLNIWKLDIAGELIFPIMLLLFGVGFLLDALRKPKKPVFRVTRNGGNAKKTTYTCDGSNDRFSCSLSFGERTQQIDRPVLAGGDASVSFGELTVDLSGCEALAENCYIQTNCSFGELRILVPRRFRVEPRTGTAFAAVNISGHPDPEPQGTIHMDANVSFGEISIRYI